MTCIYVIDYLLYFSEWNNHEAKFKMCALNVIHSSYWNVILTKWPSLTALEVIILTTYGAATNENFVKMTQFPCHWYGCCNKDTFLICEPASFWGWRKYWSAHVVTWLRLSLHSHYQPKCRHFDESFIIGCTESCQNDKKNHQNDISVSVIVRPCPNDVEMPRSGFTSP